MKSVWNDFDFFFIHIKKTDSYGEDGNFDAKVHEIEAVDAIIPRILALQPGALDRHRRPQHPGQTAQSQLASGARLDLESDRHA